MVGWSNRLLLTIETDESAFTIVSIGSGDEGELGLTGRTCWLLLAVTGLTD